MVGGRGVQGPRHLLRTYMHGNELWTSNGDELFFEAQNKYKKLNISRVDDSLGVYPVGQILHARTRI
jgi:hypothetical protein